MPRKRRVDKAREQLTDFEWDYLCDRHDAHSTDPYQVCQRLVLSGSEKLEALWQLHREVIISEHIKDNPGTRPAMWWQFDAPRLPVGAFPGCWYDGQLPEPRERIGGTGTPAYECRNVVPSFGYGIPNVWVDIDENDLPTFESQAAYLKRHGMLLASEYHRTSGSGAGW
jgi:hypothetical protein